MTFLSQETFWQGYIHWDFYLHKILRNTWFVDHHPGQKLSVNS